MIPFLLAAAVATEPALPRVPVPTGKVQCAAGDPLCSQPAKAPGQCDSGDGYAAHICRALAASGGRRFEEAAEQFELAAEAARAASSGGTPPEAARALAAAGNMWIAANRPAKAAFALDRALELAGLQAEQRGEALLDRARAAEAQFDLKTAREKLNEAAPLIGDDPFFWYMSASVAIRENDTPVAQAAIAKALALAPNDPSILFEAGHVAQLVGDDDKARGYWMRAAGNDPTGAVGKAAAKAVELLGVTPVVKSDGQPPK